MKHFKIIRGYNAEDYIEIDETELEKAYASFLFKKDGVYSGGAVRGSEIIAIQPDYHKTMGWNRGYKLGADDYAELSSKGLDSKMKLMLSETKNKVEYLFHSGQENLIGKNVSIPELDSPKNSVFREITEKIAKGFQA